MTNKIEQWHEERRKAWQEAREILIKNGFMTILHDDKPPVADGKLACTQLTGRLIEMVDAKLNSLEEKKV